MKLRIYFQPIWTVLGLAVTAAGFWTATWVLDGLGGWMCSSLALFYSSLAAISGYALNRCYVIERGVTWNAAERMLILAPHQDDCVICAGGIGIRNQKLGGETHVVYLVQDEEPGMAERRKNEAIAAWTLAGVGMDRLRHLDLLPRLHERSPQRLKETAVALRQIIDSIAPTVLVIPLFEGGHIHHDLLNYLVTSALEPRPGLKIFECPEYSPYLSLCWTPHRIIALCGRWMGGLVSYYGPPDGIDARHVWQVLLSDDELELKRRMLASFESQHGDSLAATRAYPDRLIEWQQRPTKLRPFAVEGSYVEFVLAIQRWIPRALASRLFPGQLATYGREPAITDLADEI